MTDFPGPVLASGLRRTARSVTELGAVPFALAAAGLVLLIALDPIDAQEAEGRISGRILDARTGAPVADASVSLGEARRAVTDSAGRFGFVELASGSYPLEVRHGAYHPVSDTVRVGAIATDPVEVHLAPRVYEAPALEGVVSRAEAYLDSVGFAHRMESEDGGYYLTPDSIESRAYATATQLVRTNPQIRLRRFAADEFVVFLDGRRLSRLGMRVADIVMDRIAGVEAYRCAHAPTEYRRHIDDWTSCTVVLLWRRPPGGP